MSTEGPQGTNQGGNELQIRSVKPDIVCLDGHQFRINYGVPQNVTDELEELFYQVPEVKYTDIPNHLKAYEVESDNVIAGATRGTARSE